MKEILALGTHLQPEDEAVISDLETLHIASDPLRVRILQLLIPTAMSIKQVAEQLVVVPIKLYYHFKLLEDHKLIRVAEERITHNMVERTYRARALSWRVSPDVLNPGMPGGEGSVENMLSYVFDKGKNKLKKGLMEGWIEMDRSAPPRQRGMAVRGSMRMQPDEARQFFDRLERLAEEFFNAPGTPTSGDWYDCVVSMYPIKLSTLADLASKPETKP